ncbi:SnoaL-like domain-containing protein [Lentzea fradiae]|uniref:SnoaL-like domain-containing protein n=1 Tax=Lentzea fradiae TaxID=200378 RepID=A0A1G7WFG8_9PSEU|nr:nuclear transport factor 2 family protein [Lentzea fradiae]SDG70701.1 SnoaL-like domain-containing protein [Lentzea fradiae]
MSNDEKNTADDVLRIVTLLNQFARMADEGTIPEIGALCTQDVEWWMPEVTWQGHEEVLKGLEAMRELGYAGPASRNRHVITNHEIHVDGDRAAAHSYFQLLSGDTPSSILAIGSYTDELRRDADGRWLFAGRQVTS